MAGWVDTGLHNIGGGSGALTLTSCKLATPTRSDHVRLLRCARLGSPARCTCGQAAAAMPSPPASGSAAAPPPPPAYLSDVFRFVEAHSPPDSALEVTLRPFLPDLVPALGAPDPLIKPPRPDGAPDPLGLTVLDEPAPLQSDPALLTLQLRRQARLAGGGGGARGAAAEPLGVLADPATQPVRLDACIQHVEALQLVGGWKAGGQVAGAWADGKAGALRPPSPPRRLPQDDPSAALPPGMPDLEALMQAWPPEVEAQLRAAPLPDPRQASGRLASAGSGSRTFHPTTRSHACTHALPRMHTHAPTHAHTRSGCRHRLVRARLLRGAGPIHSWRSAAARAARVVCVVPRVQAQPGV